MITVFFTLNFAPETQHHLFRMVWRSSKSSSSERKTVMSSANSVMIRCSVSPVIWRPFRLESQSMEARDSIARLKIRQDKGSPWRTPHVTL